jgi:hypothetical protein
MREAIVPPVIPGFPQRGLHVRAACSPICLQHIEHTLPAYYKYPASILSIRWQDIAALAVGFWLFLL